jgi:hypothetical protein
MGIKNIAFEWREKAHDHAQWKDLNRDVTAEQHITTDTHYPQKHIHQNNHKNTQSSSKDIASPIILSLLLLPAPVGCLVLFCPSSFAGLLVALCF